MQNENNTKQNFIEKRKELGKRKIIEEPAHPKKTAVHQAHRALINIE
jgi:hypothetical protein